MPNDQPRTKLPAGIPDALKDFIRCRANTVEIEAGDIGWLPEPDLGGMPTPGTPALTFENGETPGTISISVGWGMLAISLTGSIQDGKLHVDPPPFPGLGSEVTDWVNDFNADLEANGMQLGDLAIRGGKLHLSKQAIPAATEEAEEPPAVSVGTEPQPTTAPAVPPPAAVPGPTPGSKTAAFLDDWKTKAGVGAGALAIGVAAFFLFVDDGQTATPSSPSQPAATASTPVAAGADESDDSGSSTDSEPGTDAGSTGDDAGGSSSESSGTEDPATEDDSDAPDEEPETDPLGAFQNSDLQNFAGGSGTLVAMQPDATGDQNFCGPSQAIGADIAGVTLVQDGDMVTAGIALVQSPLTSLEDFSWAVLFQAGFASGNYRMFGTQIHDGVVTEGEQDEFGAPLADSDVQVVITEDGVLFTFSTDPADPVQYAGAFGFNLPAEDDSIGCDEAYAAATGLPAPPPSTTGGCDAGDATLCLNDRFSVEVDAGGEKGTAVPIDADTGAFWFFTPDNYEVLVRVVNACEFQGSYWVFASAATDVEYTMTVTDTATDTVQEYTNPLGEPAQPILDTAAFATCP